MKFLFWGIALVALVVVTGNHFELQGQAGRVKIKDLLCSNWSRNSHAGYFCKHTRAGTILRNSLRQGY